MTPTSVIISLSIADRRRSLAFYREALSLTAVGPMAACPNRCSSNWAG